MKKVGLHGLDAYRVSVSFYRELVAQKLAPGHLRRQILRAAESVVLNIAEAYPACGADRARRFRIACNEAVECGAALQLLEMRGELAGDAALMLSELNLRMQKMLWRLSR